MGKTKVGREAARAFWRGEKFTKGNTRVRVHDRVVTLSLHGNVIAERRTDRDYAQVTLAGGNTVTTRDRLNWVLGWLGRSVTQKDWVPYLNDAYGSEEMDTNLWYTVYVS